MMMLETRWRIELLGGLRATSGDRTLTRFRTQKAGALLGYLAYHLQRAHPREGLADLLWPDGEPARGLNNLSRELSWLRDQLEPPGVSPGAVLVADRASVRLCPTAVTTDVGAFEVALRSAAQTRDPVTRARWLDASLEEYQGRLLAGYYEAWILAEQERLAERYARALAERMTLAEEAGDLPRAIAYARRAVQADPLREEAHRELMRLLAAAGESTAALRQYHELERLLRDELGARPEAATRNLARRLSVWESDDEPLAAADFHTAPPAARVAPLVAARLDPGQEPIGGAVPLTSAFYVVRPTDSEFHAALRRQDSIVLVKGARQMGKTSLLARGLQQSRERGGRIVLTDLQAFNTSHFTSVEEFFLTVAQRMAVQLDLEVLPHEVWNATYGANFNFELYLRRHVIGKTETPVVWGLDEVDRLFTCGFGVDVFGLFRSWHNNRSLDPTGPWSRLTLAIAYATEAHLFITDVNQSPFNVGTRLTLADFTLDEVADLNRRYGCPLRDEATLARFYELVGGHPYLVRRGLQKMATRAVSLDAIETEAHQDIGIYGDHLRRLLVALTQEPEMRDIVRGVLQGEPCPTEESFYRLRSAGLISGESAQHVLPRCGLYAAYLSRHLA